MNLARDQVIQTPELLEAILLQLPPAALLRAQCLSRYIHTMIKDSPSLQQYLFQRAAHAAPSGAWSINPLFKKPFLPWLVILKDVRELRLIPGFDSLHMLDWTQTVEQRDQFLRPEASWRTMFFIQPPPTKLRVEAWDVYGAHRVVDVCELHLATGMTMDVLYDIAQEFLRDAGGEAFGLVVKTQRGKAPDITMHVCSLRRNTTKLSPSLRSRAQRVWTGDDLSAVDGVEASPGDNNFYERLGETHLTPAQGGVLAHEFEKWTRERAPLASLVSDVR
ncbi:hypothetical protein EJ04DRAFT_510066 [Polyplosphaeria fusca]|uniref:F-box domain-containing protein n=1 Tax=Polyplosphaeria fusca TaxID=682080 RepID=A0A9P4R6F6_9PLEO|nr:hypothetical protein EJ04DRAFT_510066 [Polyplosphaeria fusca]